MKPSKHVLNLVQSKQEADKAFNAMFNARIMRLSNVADSVLRKSGMGTRSFSAETIESSFPVETHWFFEWASNRKLNPPASQRTRPSTVYSKSNHSWVNSVDEAKAYCARYKNGDMFFFDIPLDVLALSDRDFAKLIRKGIKKMRSKEQYLENERRKKQISDMKNAIEELTDDINKLEQQSREYHSYASKEADKLMELAHSKKTLKESNIN